MKKRGWFERQVSFTGLASLRSADSKRCRRALTPAAILPGGPEQQLAAELITR